MKKIVKEVNGRTFELVVSDILFGNYFEISIYEVVRPTWKIFRTKYLDQSYISVEDCNDLKFGVIRVLKGYLEKERKEQATKEKIKNLYKTLDNNF